MGHSPTNIVQFNAQDYGLMRFPGLRGNCKT